MMAKIASTGMLATNSMPFESTSRETQIVRGIVVERMSLASRVKARVQSEIAPVNHIQGRRPVSRNTMYGSSPTPRSNTWVKTNQ